MSLNSANHGVFGGCAPGVQENPARAGLAPVVGAAMAEASKALAASEPVQESLFEPAGRMMSAEEAREERKAGRPKGATNKASGDLRRFLQRQGVDPHMIMAEYLALSPEELAARLGCSRADAFDRQIKMAESLMPYVRAKLAPVDDTGRAVPVMVFQMGGQAAPMAANGLIKPPYVVEGEAMGLEYEIVDNQWVSKALAGHSVTSSDDEGEKA